MAEGACGVSKAGDATVWFVGVLPPPVTGMTTVSDWMVAEISKITTLRSLSVRRSGLARRIWPVAKHAGLIIEGLKAAGTAQTGDHLYFVMDSGPGAAGSIVLAVLGRLAGLKIVAHHHVFAYLDRPTVLSRLFFWICGDRAVHLVLCGCMQARLQRVYGARRRTEILSNRWMLRSDGDWRPRAAVSRIGFLSNISREKGIDLFVETLERIQHARPEVEAVIAGPAPTPDVQRLIGGFVERSPSNRRYLGPVYGQQKQAFLSEIDLLLFPSRYRNEAEPLTIYEALAHGAPVLATGRGCIREQLPAGCIAPDEEGFPGWAADVVEGWIQNPSAFKALIAEPPSRNPSPLDDILKRVFRP